MCGRVFRNRGSKFPEQNCAFWRLISACSAPSKSVSKNRCLIGHPRTPFGKHKNADPYSVSAWATLPLNGTFDLKDGSCGRDRPREKLTDRRSITKKCGSPLLRSPCWGSSFAETGCRTSHFQSLKMSSIALSNAVFKLFSIILIISASRTDCFFFLSFSRSFF